MLLALKKDSFITWIELNDNLGVNVVRNDASVFITLHAANVQIATTTEADLDFK